MENGQKQKRLSTFAQGFGDSSISSSDSEPEERIPDRSTSSSAHPKQPQSPHQHGSQKGASHARVSPLMHLEDNPIFHLMHHDYTEQPGHSGLPGPSLESVRVANGFGQQRTKRQRLSIEAVPALEHSDNMRGSSTENIQLPSIAEAMQSGLRYCRTSPQQDMQGVNKCETTSAAVKNQNVKSAQSDLNQRLLNLLECPVCLEYIQPPVIQCLNGHLICAMCRSKVCTCPTCRARFSDLHNFAMEVVAEQVKYPCSNVSLGCRVTLLPHEHKAHEANCMYQKFDCVLTSCQWTGLHSDFLYHIVDKHHQTFIYGSQVVLTLPLSNLHSIDWIVAAHNEIFRVNFMAANGIHVNGCVQFIGPKKRAGEFKYILKMPETPHKQTHSQILYSRAAHEYMADCSEYYTAGDCFYISEKTARMLGSGQPGAYTIPVKLHIDKISCNDNGSF